MVMDLTRRIGRKMRGGGASDLEAAERKIQRDTVAGDFDAAFYAERYPDVTEDHLEHFMVHGWREMRDPAPWFSTAFYLRTNPDIEEAGLNPFYHYVTHGRAEGRFAAPADQPAEELPWEVLSIRQGLDRDYYAGQLREAGIDPKGADLALHYWREGAAMGLDPTPDFSTSHYVSAHEDVAAAGINPFAHYLEEGRKEGRSTKGRAAPVEAPKIEEKLAPPDEPAPRKSAKNDHRDLVATSFDATYYLAANPDVAAAKVDPLDHFMSNGWREGRNPNLSFSVSHYLDFYPDVAEAGINPFLHYLMAGKAEGRTPRHDLGFRYDIIASMQPLEKRIEHARASAPKRARTEPAKLREALRGAMRLETKGLYVSVSHDDFTENFGGVQLVLMRESAAVDAKGLDHLHIFPATPLQVAEMDVADPVVGVLLNRKRIGFFTVREMEQALYEAAPRIRTAPFVIHSLIGHRADALVGALKAAGCKSGYYWIHDYSSVCTGYTLLRNDVEFCGGPAPTSAACSICVYGDLRVTQMKAHEVLFNELDLTVLAPSEAALDVWKASASVMAPAVVHEHLKLDYAPAKAKPAKRSRPLRVAYVGQPVAHKGWPVFKELTLRFGDDARYEFFHVGKGPQGIPGTFTEVAVGADDLDKMVRTLRELEIDVAIIWSLWPETFCIAAVEALRAGAAVLTFKDSGNVAAIVRKTGFGAVLDSEDELNALFETGDVVDLAARTRPDGLTAEFSDMTADFIEEKVA